MYDDQFLAEVVHPKPGTFSESGHRQPISDQQTDGDERLCAYGSFSETGMTPPDSRARCAEARLESGSWTSE